ncbi:MAG TPA: cytochrome P450 [Acidimicrobiales bacterium]|nr:cytochrome P450 [Acidimicrobiales bacterium]
MTITTEAVYFDLYDRELYASPYPMYRRLRDEAPLYHNEEHDFYVVSRFDDVARVLSDRNTFSSAKGGVYQIASAAIDMPEGLFIFEDPPLHAIHRSLVSRLFTPRAVSRIEPQIRELFDGAAAALVGRDRFDFVKDFANMLPIQVIGMLLGLPSADHAALRDAFFRSQNEATADPDRDALGGIAEAAVWFNEYLDERAANPADDLMTQLLTIEFEDHTGTVRLLRRDELLTFLTLITGAGSDTTVNAISWAGSLLSDHPDQRRMLLEDPTLIPNAVEEVLRYEAIPYHVARTTTTDVELHGHTVPAGSIVLALPASANRDERHHRDPDIFDVTRRPGQIFTFSYGPHFCLGASLARLEARLAVEAALTHWPGWVVDRSGAALTTGIDTRGWERLPVEV